MTDTTAPKPRLDLVVIDCPDALELAQFYARILGWKLEEGSDQDWADLEHPDGGIRPDNPDGRTALAFQRIPDFGTPTWPGGTHPQQFHLDLACGDIAATEPMVLEAGAVRHEHQPSEDGSFVVYRDPAGHPFCLIR